MKRIIFLTLALAGSIAIQAQTGSGGTGTPRVSESRYLNNDTLSGSRGNTTIKKYSVLPRWVIDVNLMGGLLNQNLDVPNTTGNYLNAINSNISKPEFINGMTYGADVQLGVFFGPKRHFGIGTGLLYFYQMGDLDLAKFKVEYQATDYRNDVYRQVISTSKGAKEAITISNFNIPLLLKYKTKFSKRWGFTVDAGVLFNVQNTHSYNSDASFDYEAIYKYEPTETGVRAVYDNSPIPSSTSILFTKAHAGMSHSDAQLVEYFNGLRAMGYNVGLNVKPTTNSGDVSFTTGSIGYLVRPAMSLYLNDNVALNFGVFYAYQKFSQEANSSYMFTNSPGDYTSALKSVKSSDNHSYGLNAGIRFLFGAPRDRDKDGIPDRNDKCPDVKGVPEFEGCPDTDGDGIPDREDSCVFEKGPRRFYGCPDRDSDGLPDKFDKCPTEAGPIEFQGCPDRDLDGIIDREDRCPDDKGTLEFKGCPDRDGDKTPDIDDRCPDVPGPISNQGCPIELDTTSTGVRTLDISDTLLFDFNKSTIKSSSFRILNKLAEELKNDESLMVDVTGHADAIGTPEYNKDLSVRRANAVKTYLLNRGVKSQQVKATGMGEDDPVAPNDTPEGREQNRRAELEVKEK